MVNLQVQQTHIPTGKVDVLFTIETKESSKSFMTNELHLMYDDRVSDIIDIKVVEINVS